MTVLKQDKNKSILWGSITDKIELAVMYIVLIVMAAAFIVPFYWLVVSSLKRPSEMFVVPVQWLPSEIQFDNYKNMFGMIPFFQYLKNTMVLVLNNVLGSLISSSLVAYGFSRLRWKGRDQVFVLVLISMILPYMVTMIPLYLLFRDLGWLGTMAPLLVPLYFGNPFFIFLMRQFFSGLPHELSEAARIDGAGEFRIYWQICLPLAKPAMATVAIFAFLRSWSDYIGPLIYLQDSSLYTLSIGVQLIRSNLDPKWAEMMAAGVVMVSPVLLLFFLLQKYFIQGIALSGIKG
ncbi:carbohydrate ABC transporter permease [Eubacteriales bacterium OttesenSCG-928-N13]|nr:carbohydrate ABC transporter permease [Eubacteriales bacterium OttesenSCG-928-N13]